MHIAESLQKNYQVYNCAVSSLNIAIAALRTNLGSDSDKALIDLPSDKKNFLIDSCRCSIEVTDENGKINVNSLIDQQGKSNKSAIEQLLRLTDILNRHPDCHIDYGFVTALIDWLDADENVCSLPLVRGGNRGAESDYYLKLNPPYKSRNSSIEAIDELILVKGITSETFDRLHDYVTVYGDGKININSAPKEVIESLSEKIDSGLAATIIDKRNLKPFKTIAELHNLPWMTEAIYNEIKNKLTTRPNEQYYSITAQADGEAHSYTIIATIKLNNETKKIDVISYKEQNREQDKA
jgi:general secretion pathway protein K